MQLVTELPGAATTILTARDGAVYLVAAGRLLALRGEELSELAKGDIGGAAVGVDGNIYYTHGGCVMRLSAAGDEQSKEVSKTFGDPAGNGRVVRTRRRRPPAAPLQLCTGRRLTPTPSPKQTAPRSSRAAPAGPENPGEVRPHHAC